MVDGVNPASLRALLDRSGPLLPVRAVSVITQVAAALDAADAEQVLRADVVDPTNIVLTANDLASLVDADAEGQEGSSLAGLAYLAPERLTHNAPVSVATDVYALACVLFECLTGKTPYPVVDDLSAVVTAHQSASIPLPSHQLGSVPTGFDQVIARGMAKDPAQRYRSAGELAVAAQQGLSSAVSTESTPLVYLGPSPTAAASRRHRLRIVAITVAAVVVVVALIAGVGALVVTRRHASPTPTAKPTHVMVDLGFPKISNLAAVAVDNRGTVYVSDSAAGVWQLRADTGVLTQLNFPGVHPTGVAVDTGANVYVTGHRTASDGKQGDGIWKLAAGSNTVVELPINEPIFTYQLAADGGGNLYIIGTDYGTVTPVRVWKLPVNSENLTILPFDLSLGVGGVAADTAGNVYVTDPEAHMVFKWVPGSTTVTQLVQADTRGIAGGVAVSPAGDVYISARGTYSGEPADTDFGIVTSGSVDKLGPGWRRTSLPFRLESPKNLAVDTAGNVYVVDTIPNTVEGHVLKLST